MKELEFDIGGPVEKTLKPHGVPYKGQNTDGYIDYGYIGFPDGVVTAVFKKPGLDIRFFPVYAMTFYSDDRLSPSNTIATADISMSKNGLHSHEKAYAAINQLLDQFRRGEWQRFIPSSCPSVTGRSTLLGLSGTVDDRRVACPIDPDIKLSLEEFSKLSGQGLVWMWIADDRIAKLEVDGSSAGTRDASSYSINLSFELKDAYEFYRNQRELEKVKDQGEASVLEAKKRGMAQIKQLEEAAIKRGDKVLPK